MRGAHAELKRESDHELDHARAPGPDHGPLLRSRSDRILTLQRTIGNRAVSCFVGRYPGPPFTPAPASVADIPPPPPPAIFGPPPPPKLSCPLNDADVTNAQPAQTVAPPATTPTPAAATDQPVVPDVTIPVTFTEIVDDRKVSELTPDGDFTGIAELKRFAGALADEYLARQRAATDYGRTTRGKISQKIYDALKKQAKADADKQADDTGADKKARKKLEDDAVKAVAKPSDADVDAALATARDDQLKALASSWDAHVQSPQAKNMKVSTLANGWMRNRQEELLVVTETITRAAGQFNMWATGALPSLDSFPVGLDGDASAGKPLSDAPGGIAGGPTALVHPATIKFLTALHNAFPHVTFQNYHNHGSWPLAGRGLSVDMYLGGRDKANNINYDTTTSRQFWDRSNVAQLIDAIEATAKSLDFRYFAIYNDYAVEKWADARTVYGSVGFVGGLDKSKSLNYHGGGIKLHVHLDLVPPEMRAAPAATAPAGG